MNPEKAQQSETPFAGANLTTNVNQDGKNATAEQLIKEDLAAFINTYKIRAIEGEPSQVACTIPTDKTYADFLREGQALSIALHESVSLCEAFFIIYIRGQAINPELFKKLLVDPDFQVKGTGLETITDGRVSKTKNENRYRATQKLTRQGLSHEEDRVLVAAHTARYLLDATSIFQGYVVRAARGAFIFDEFGLKERCIPDHHGYRHVVSSARLAPSE